MNIEKALESVLNSKFFSLINKEDNVRFQYIKNVEITGYKFMSNLEEGGNRLDLYFPVELDLVPATNDLYLPNGIWSTACYNLKYPNTEHGRLALLMVLEDIIQDKNK